MNSNDATEPNGPVPFLHEKRILLTAALVLLADQLTKLIVTPAFKVKRQYCFSRFSVRVVTSI